MMLACPLFSTPIPISENKIPVAVVENPMAFRKFVFELICQANGENGEFVLSEKFTPIDIKKHICVISDVFSVDVNQKKILSGLSSLIKAKAVSEDFYQSTGKILSEVNTYFADVLSAVEFPVSIPEFDMEMLVKAASLHLESSFESFLEGLISYMLAVREFCGCDVFVFINLKTLLCESELQQLYDAVMYKKINIILFENAVGSRLENEEVFVVDNDLCEI